MAAGVSGNQIKIWKSLPAPEEVIPSFQLVPENQETMYAFGLINFAPNDEPPEEQTEEAARDIDNIWRSIENAAARWRGNQLARVPGHPMNRQEFWDHMALLGGEVPLFKIFDPFLQDLESSNGVGKLAIDLGCGRNQITKCLLEKGWRVIAVDLSRVALAILASTNEKAFQDGRLQIVEGDMTEFIPSEAADLVIARNSLPYIDPLKFKTIWTKIHSTFVKENGWFVGSLFRAPTDPQDVKFMHSLKEYGAWMLPDRRMVRALLKSTGYHNESCVFRKDYEALKQARVIEFRAQKISMSPKSSEYKKSL